MATTTPTTTTPLPRLITVSRFAREIDSTPSTVRKFANEGMPHVRLGTGRQAQLRIVYTEAMRWLEERTSRRPAGKCTMTATPRTKLPESAAPTLAALSDPAAAPDMGKPEEHAKIAAFAMFDEAPALQRSTLANGLPAPLEGMLGEPGLTFRKGGA